MYPPRIWDFRCRRCGKEASSEDSERLMIDSLIRGRGTPEETAFDMQRKTFCHWCRSPRSLIGQPRYATNDEYRHAEKMAFAEENDRTPRIRAVQAKRSRPLSATRTYIGEPCVYCGGPADTLDHIDALMVGGEHDTSNIAPACQSCNSSKNTKSLLHFLAWRRARRAS